MKLAIWNTNYFRRFGGAEMAVHNLLNRFSELGIETFLIANRMNRNQISNPCFEPLDPKVKIYQNTFTNPWDNLKRPFQSMLKFFTYIKASIQFFFFLSKNKIPLIHLHYVSWDIALLAFYKLIFRYRLVVTFRAGEDEIAWQIHLSRIKIKIALKFADSVSAVSKDLCEKLKRKYSFSNALYIPNGVDIRQIQGAAIQSPALKEDNFVFCGRLSAQKRVDFLIEAFSECIKRGCEQNLYLVGDGEDMERIKQLIRSRQLQNRVITLGALDHPHTLGVIRQSRCVLLTSVFEGSPQIVLEAMAFAKPVIASDIGGLRDLVIHGESGYLYPVNRLDLFSDWIMTISHDQAKACELGARGFQILSTKFPLDGAVKRYLEVYRSLGIQDESVIIAAHPERMTNLQQDEHFV